MKFELSKAKYHYIITHVKEIKPKYVDIIIKSLYIDKALQQLGFHNAPIYVIEVSFDDGDLNDMLNFCNDLYNNRFTSDEAYERFDDWSEFGNFLLEYKKLKR